MKNLAELSRMWQIAGMYEKEKGTGGVSIHHARIGIKTVMQYLLTEAQTHSIPDTVDVATDRLPKTLLEVTNDIAIAFIESQNNSLHVAGHQLLHVEAMVGICERREERTRDQV